MNVVKKLSIQVMPADYSPRFVPEIVKLVKRLAEQEAVVYENAEKRPFLFETSRLIIRRFYPEDAADVHILANDRNRSVMKNYDHPWPTDEPGCRKATDWFASRENMWAVCLKPDYPLIGMIVFNTMDAQRWIDLGHVWHTEHWHAKLDTEAISLMVQYAFEHLGAEGVYAHNPLDCAPQIAPLLDVGMALTETIPNASFAKDEEGHPIYFTGCRLEITRERWNEP
ncbi:GNAT family N-acetyltransferase [Gorillibacterium sp. sgz5001074]|uniref:GNAT family N-acetyltransferase n=1 Tax=Gorillibacterium sp. sgz5001074 TaxID=3446695 RepID=UPI003F677C79